MKKTLLFMLAMVLSFGFASADNKTLTLNATASDWTGDENGYTTTLEGFEISYLKNESQSNLIAPSDDHIRVYKNAMLQIKGLQGETITSVVMNVTGTKYAVDMAVGSEVATGNADTKTVTWTGSTTNFQAVANVGQVRIASIDITYTTGDVKVLAPEIEGETLFEGSTDVTITGEAGTTIYYTLDGTEPTTASALNGASPVSFKVSEATTVKAIAVKGADASVVAEKTFTPVTFTDVTVAELNAMEEDKAYINLTFKDAKVTYVDNYNVYVREGGKAIMLYGLGLDIPVNAVLNGSVKCDFDNYYGIIEVKSNKFTSADALVITPSTEAAVPTIATVADVLALKNICDYVLLEKVQIVSEANGDKENYFAVQGEARVQLYKGIDVSEFADNGQTYYVTGVFNQIYKGAAEIQPIGVTTDSPITGIENVVVAPEKATIYTLDGRRVAAPVKGINIINGKKVLVL